MRERETYDCEREDCERGRICEGERDVIETGHNPISLTVLCDMKQARMQDCGERDRIVAVRDRGFAGESDRIVGGVREIGSWLVRERGLLLG